MSMDLNMADEENNVTILVLYAAIMLAKVNEKKGA